MSMENRYRVVGGSLTLPDEFPHQVAIHYNDNFICAGSILSTLLILTAAHCVASLRHIYLFTVIAGLHNITDDNGKQRVRNVKFIYVHDQYNRESLANDIAIMVLSQPLVYTSLIKSVNLPQHNEVFGGHATVSGWGKTLWGGLGSVQLRKADVPIVHIPDCRISYQYRRHISDQQLCMGDSTRETCQGDSGGAALCKRNDGMTVQCGIVSFGSRCGEEGIPGVYTRVSTYIGWIEAVEKKIIALPRTVKNYRHYNYSELSCIPGTFLCNAGWTIPFFNHPFNLWIACRRGEFRCNNGRCIRRELTCNKKDDCGDGSDETCDVERLPCASGYQCALGGSCFEANEKCNEGFWCLDASDEEYCANYDQYDLAVKEPCVTEDYSFYCPKDFVCVHITFWCDGEIDCPSGADELDCVNAEISKAKWRESTQTLYNILKFNPFQRLADKLKSSKRTSESACLKAGTKILMANGREKEVQYLRLGDYVLDMDLNPTKILGVNYQYNKHLALYGFDNTLPFFTSEHMFVGQPTHMISNSTNATNNQYYVVSLHDLLENNPLIKYWNVEEIRKQRNHYMYHYDSNSKIVEAKSTLIYQDTSLYPPETPVYFIHVDSPSGTYFANGYVCKVDMPPLEMWPNTMGLLFNVLRIPKIDDLSKLTYTLDNMRIIDGYINSLANSIEPCLTSFKQERIELNSESYTVMSLKDEGVNNSMHRILNEPTMAFLSKKLYARLGKIFSPILDSEDMRLDVTQVARVQHELFTMVSK